MLVSRGVMDLCAGKGLGFAAPGIDPRFGEAWASETTSRSFATTWSPEIWPRGRGSRPCRWCKNAPSSTLLSSLPAVAPPPSPGARRVVPEPLSVHAQPERGEASPTVGCYRARQGLAQAFTDAMAFGCGAAWAARRQPRGL